MSRKSDILNAGVALWPDISSRRIAKRLNISHPTVLNHVSMDELRDAVAAHAVAISDKRVIRLLLLDGHPAVADMDEAERAEWFKGV